jgi:integrase
MAGVRRKPQPSGKYQGWFIAMDGQRKFFVGTRSRPETFRMAQRLEDEHRQIRLGYRPLPAPSDRHRTRPLAEVVQEYLAWGQLQGGRRGYPWSPRHFENRRRHLAWWQTQLSLERLGDLEGCLPTVEAALQALEPKHASKTLAQYAESLGAFCDWCVNRHYLSEDPLKALGRLSTTPQTRRRALSADEIERLLHGVPAYMRLVYETALLSGLRRQELQRLTLSHLDRARGGLQLTPDLTKNREAAFQPLPPRLIEELDAFARAGFPQELYARALQRKDAKRLVPQDALLYVPLGLAQRFTQDLARVGIAKEAIGGKLDFHATRVTYINLVIEAGASVKEAQALARHATPALTLGVYGRTREGRLHEVVGQVAQTLERATSVHTAETVKHTYALNDSHSDAYSLPLRMENTGFEPVTSALQGRCWCKCQYLSVSSCEPLHTRDALTSCGFHAYTLFTVVH